MSGGHGHPRTPLVTPLKLISKCICEIMRNDLIAASEINLVDNFSRRRAGLWDFTMAPAQFVRKLARNGVFRFTASIDAGGVPVHVEILAGIRYARPTFAVGFSFDRQSFGKLAEKLSGIDVDFLDKLGLELEVELLLLLLFVKCYRIPLLHSINR